MQPILTPSPALAFPAPTPTASSASPTLPSAPHATSPPTTSSMGQPVPTAPPPGSPLLLPVSRATCSATPPLSRGSVLKFVGMESELITPVMTPTLTAETAATTPANSSLTSCAPGGLPPLLTLAPPSPASPSSALLSLMRCRSQSISLTLS